MNNRNKYIIFKSKIVFYLHNTLNLKSHSWLIFFENKSFFKSKTVLYVLYFHKKIFLKSQIEIWEYTFQKSINHDSTRSF